MLRLVFVCAVFVLALSPPASASNSIIGAWRGPLTMNGMECQIGVVLQSDGHYSSTQKCTNMGVPYPPARQTGTYKKAANNTVSFQVEDWEPKTQILPGPNGGPTKFELPKPPGGTYMYKFTSANTSVWRDLSTGGSITYTRVR